MSLDIVIVSFKVPFLLQECIRSIVANTDIEYKLWLIDNNSQDFRIKIVADENYFADEDKCSRLLFLDENIGYGRAANIGIEEGASPYVLLLNNDIILSDGYTQLITYLSENKDVGIVGPKLINYDNKIVGAGVVDNKTYHTVQGWLQPNSPDKYNEVMDVVYVGGAALFMSREMLEKLKVRDGYYFDPALDFYFEDYSIAIRARSLGYKVKYCPLVTLIHKHEGSLEECPPGSIGSREWRHQKHDENKARFTLKYPDLEI